MKLIAGLGNPGSEYAATRHNVGFMTVERIAREHGMGDPKNRYRSKVWEGFVGTEKVILVQPQTYMNLSGHAIGEALRWYHLAPDQLLVIADDLDLPFGTLRMRERGSSGGQNGLNSIIEQLGGSGFPRLRIGIGRGPSQARAHVLSRFAPAEQEQLSDVIGRAAAGAALWVTDGPIAAMNEINRKPEKPAQQAEPDQEGAPA